MEALTGNIAALRCLHYAMHLPVGPCLHPSGRVHSKPFIFKCQETPINVPSIIIWVEEIEQSFLFMLNQREKNVR
jgi:hypothetical protein